MKALLAEHVDKSTAADEALRRVECDREVFHQQGLRADVGCCCVPDEDLGATVLVSEVERAERARAFPGTGTGDRTV